MSSTGESPFGSPPGTYPPGGYAGGQRPPGSGLVRFLAVVLVSVVAGLIGGLVWVAVAPRASYVVISHGSADVINAETSAFIAGDAVYCIIGVVGGLLIGLAGYLIGVRRYGPLPMVAVLGGSIVAGIVTRWVGEHSGLTAFNHQLLTSPLGTHLQAPLALAGDTSATTWPTLAALPEVAFWPLAACVVAGGLTLLVILRERSAAAQYAVPVPGPR